MKILYVVTKLHNFNTFKEKVEKGNYSKIFLCPIEYGCQEYVSDVINYLKEKGIQYQEIDFLSIFNENAFAKKSQFLEYIYDLGIRKINKKQNFIDFFQVPGNNFSAWWLSLVKENNPFKSNTYTLFIKLLTIFDLKQTHMVSEIWLDDGAAFIKDAFKTNELNKSIINLNKKSISFRNKIFVLKRLFIEQCRTIKYFFGLLFKIIILKFYNFKCSQRFKRLKDGDYFLITMFPFIDKEALRGGKFKNKAFGAIQDSIAEHGKKKIVWYAMFTRIENYSWFDSLKLAKQINKSGETIIFEEEFLGLRGLLKAFINYTIICTKTTFNMGSFKSKFYLYYKNNDIDLWNIFREDFLSSFSGKELFLELCHYYGFLHSFSKLKEGSKILYFCEMHGWENAINVCANKFVNIKSIGLQHTIVPLLLLHYFHDKRELIESNNYSMPQPDLIGCVGDITRNLFIENGWDEKKIFNLGAFRFHNLLRNANVDDSSANKKNQIVVAFSISDLEVEEILYLLNEAFNNNRTDFKILMKAHPCHSLEATINRLGLKLDSNIFEITNKPLNVIAPESKGMIVKESSSIFEALAVNIPAVVPLQYSIVNLCPLAGITDIPIFAKGAKDLFNIVKEIIEGKTRGERNKYLDFIKQYLNILDEESGYFDNLEKGINSISVKDLKKSSCCGLN